MSVNVAKIAAKLGTIHSKTDTITPAHKCACVVCVSIKMARIVVGEAGSDANGSETVREREIGRSECSRIERKEEATEETLKRPLGTNRCSPCYH